ncbi:MAG TPA: cytochrome c biogenesis protein CcdA [Gemmatimonadales bacterium]
MTTGVGPLVAFAGGLLSFLSPCVLPLVPSYIGFLAGMTGDDLRTDRHRAVAHAVAFIAGFSLVFIALGAAATALGAGLLAHKLLLARIGGLLILVFGLYTLGVLRISAFDRERRMHLDDKPVGFLGSVLVGMAFAAGWTPCIGPILGGILVLAGSSASVSHGVLLLAAYSAGLAVPFLIAAVALDAFMAWFRRFRRWMPWVQRISGAILVVVGVLMVSGEFTRLAFWLQSLTPAALQRGL